MCDDGYCETGKWVSVLGFLGGQVRKPWPFKNGIYVTWCQVLYHRSQAQIPFPDRCPPVDTNQDPATAGVPATGHRIQQWPTCTKGNTLSRLVALTTFSWWTVIKALSELLFFHTFVVRLLFQIVWIPLHLVFQVKCNDSQSQVKWRLSRVEALDWWWVLTWDLANSRLYIATVMPHVV